jgi:hypothetical protein
MRIAWAFAVDFLQPAVASYSYSQKMPKGLRRYYSQDHLHYLTCSCYHRWAGYPSNFILRFSWSVAERFHAYSPVTSQENDRRVARFLPVLSPLVARGLQHVLAWNIWTH